MAEDGLPIKTLRNLNLSYNSLYFDDTSENESLWWYSFEFVENFIEYIGLSQMLYHLDISGMNLGRE